MTKLLTSLTAVAVAAAAVAFFVIAQPHAHAAENATIGEAAPDFTLKNVVTGEDVALADHQGKVTVLIFHSTSCPWYRMREDGGYDRVFVKTAEAYKDKDVAFIGINSNRTDSTEKVKAYVEKHNINYTVVKDPNNVIADAYQAKVTPHVFVVGKDGKLAYKGGVEERPSNPKACGDSDVQYLGPAIDALLEGSEVEVQETKPVGCSIKRV